MPRDFRYSHSRSPRRSRTRSPKRDRYRNDYNSSNDRYRDDRRDDRRGGGNDDRYDRSRRSMSNSHYGGSNGNGYRDNRGGDRYSQRDRERDRSGDRRGSGGDEDIDQCRIHIADLTNNVTQYDIEKAFMKFGEIKEVWMAKNPPCFAFVVFKNKQDAAEAVKEMDNKMIGHNRCRVTFARPRTRGRKRRWDPNMRCYQCGERGHFSRDCDGGASGRRRHERSYSRGRSGRRSRSRSRSYSRSR